MISSTKITGSLPLMQARNKTMITEAKTLLKLRQPLVDKKIDQLEIDLIILESLMARKTYRGIRSPLMKMMTPSIIRESWLISLLVARNLRLKWIRLLTQTWLGRIYMDLMLYQRSIPRHSKTSLSDRKKVKKKVIACMNWSLMAMILRKLLLIAE